MSGLSEDELELLPAKNGQLEPAALILLLKVDCEQLMLRLAELTPQQRGEVRDMAILLATYMRDQGLQVEFSHGIRRR
jgi:hypothetical protein